MTATLPGAGPSRGTAGRRRGMFWVLLVVGILVVAVIGGRPSGEGRPYAPDSVGSSGAKAVRELVESFDADVDVSDEIGEHADVVLVLVDELTDRQRDDLVDWVAEGGRLVIADPASPLTPVVAETLDPFGFDEPRLPEDCSVDALDEVGTIAPGVPADYEVPDDGAQCFGPTGTAFVVAAPRGDGVQVSIGGPDVFTNGRLDEADNAVLAVSLLAPEPGTEITWLTRDASVPAETTSLWALVSPGGKAAVLQLCIAAGAYVLVRGRRLGRPLSEPQQVQLAGSELVAAVGHLLQQSRDPDRAARLLRADLRRSLRERLGLGGDASAELVAQVVASRCSLDRSRVDWILLDHPVGTDDVLVALAADIDTLKEEVLHGHAPRAR
jgi:hypothetical protein